MGALSSAGHTLWRLVRRLAPALLRTIVLLWALATVGFVLLELAPGSAADKLLPPDAGAEAIAALEIRYGLHAPPSTRYLRWLSGLLRGDLGISLTTGTPVLTRLGIALPATLLLTFTSLCTSFAVGTCSGIALAVLRAPARVRTVGALAGLRVPTWALRLAPTADAVTLGLWAAPSFLVAFGLQLLAPRLHLPTTGMKHPVLHDDMGTWQAAWDVAQHLVLPGVAMGMVASAGVARFMARSLTDQLQQPYLLALSVRGLPPLRVLGHAVRNAALPVITLLGLSLPYLVGGSVVVETIFAWPGVGQLLLEAIETRDTPLVLGCFLLLAAAVMLGNAAADATIRAVDPRTQRTASGVRL